MAKEQLIENVIALGKSTGKFTATKGDDSDLVIEHIIVDAEYYKVVGEEKTKKVYRAYMLFDEETKEAKYNEEMTDSSRDVGFSAADGKFSFGQKKSFFKGKVIGSKQTEKVWGIRKDDLSLSKVVDYTFDVKDIRKPIEEMLDQNGWKLSQVVFKKDATYKKKDGGGWFGKFK
ncbi:MAG: hypothetical protein AUJ08_00750 [Thaumarchaeota archaeon 13_1_40CM_3_50_5]|nr:MAG: hypothetical protein AUH71_00725 [Thaumarchaeota archaeon 13_1_40CM_4_48_7]OLC87235.1 MAG: hypothetical protein AUJ08_00750 [Thaumarchaeota archaeon 13_1_40CM_3_50_5]